MSSSDYVFNEKDADKEKVRLQQIEKLMDPTTLAWLKPTGVGPGWSVLEVGPGAGSIMRWMLKQTAPDGQVTAVDLHPVYVKDEASDRLAVEAGDFRTVSLPEASFDLIHARYVITHVPDYQEGLKKLLSLLKPGGWIVVEEADFKQTRFFEGKKISGARKVGESIQKMFEKKNIDPGAASKLPEWFLKAGLVNIHTETDAPLTVGASPMANMMSLSADQLREEYKTGGATDDDIESFLTFCADLNSSAIFYATVRCRGQKK